MKSLIVRMFSRLRKNEDGTQLVETAIWLGIISAVTIGAIVAMAPVVEDVFDRVSDAMQALLTPPAG
jgi:Flp pilus assembly pilin Flp